MGGKLKAVYVSRETNKSQLTPLLYNLQTRVYSMKPMLNKNDTRKMNYICLEFPFVEITAIRNCKM